MVHTTMDMTIDEGRVFGARYYTVEPQVINWNLDGDWGGIDIWDQMELWCTETYGESKGAFEPSQRWYANSSRFWFREKKDLEWFILKWQ